MLGQPKGPSRPPWTLPPRPQSGGGLEAAIEAMKRDKFINQNNKNAQDKEYERLVIKYFTPFQFLRHWFDEREIVLACADSGITLRDLCSETNVEPGAKCHYSKAEYLRTSFESVPQYFFYYFVEDISWPFKLKIFILINSYYP